jgi:hypothetical protein
MAAFFLTNYVAHLFSLKGYAAETSKGRVVTMATALFYPAFGLLRALEFIRHWYTGGIQTLWRRRNELERTQNAEALYMVVTSWDGEPEESEQLTHVLDNYMVACQVGEHAFLDTIGSRSAFQQYECYDGRIPEISRLIKRGRFTCGYVRYASVLKGRWLTRYHLTDPRMRHWQN